MNNIIEVRTLSKSFGNIKAVDDISLSVRKGELFAFLGPNGAGKSTTIKILCTLLAKDSGTAEVCGLEAGKSDSEIRRKIGVVFDSNCLDDLLTVRQNLIFRAHLYENDKRKIGQSLDRVSSVLHLEDLLRRPFGELSTGQKRRCEIARALMNSPEILFLDEPTTGLDPQTRQNVWECLDHIRREHNTTVFMSTHYMEEAANADSIAIIDKGRIAAMGTPLELRQMYSADTLRIASEDSSRIKDVFGELSISYQQKAGTFHIKLPNSLKALEILKPLEKYISSFEVVHGTMDDVFLNLTGRLLRED